MNTTDRELTFIFLAELVRLNIRLA